LDPSSEFVVKDHYATLGIPPDAEAQEIKAAYRQLAQVHHPDLNPYDPEATEQFLEIKEAYDCLSDEAAREVYDLEYVEYFPGYELEEQNSQDSQDSFGDSDEAVWGTARAREDSPGGSSGDPHGANDGSTWLFRVFLVLLLPLVCGGVVMNITGDFTWTVVAAVGGLLAGIWIGAVVRG
jgi:curved DNA-binding protein CbpA